MSKEPIYKIIYGFIVENLSDDFDDNTLDVINNEYKMSLSSARLKVVEHCFGDSPALIGIEVKTSQGNNISEFSIDNFNKNCINAKEIMNQPYFKEKLQGIVGDYSEPGFYSLLDYQ